MAKKTESKGSIVDLRLPLAGGVAILALGACVQIAGFEEPILGEGGTGTGAQSGNGGLGGSAGATVGTSSSTGGMGGGGGCSIASQCPDPGTECEMAACNSGQCGKANVAEGMVCGTNNVCDGNGACVGCTMASQCPGIDDTCQTRTCINQTCGFNYASAGTTCNQTDACDGAGVCKLGNGSSCSLGSECFSDFCADGVCCNSACTDACSACSFNVKGQGPNGTCGPIKGGLDPDNECMNGACDGATACKYDNGTVCAVNADCLSGFCADGVCCDTACSATCKACNVNGMVGTCSNVPSKQDDVNCTGTTQSCDGNGTCKKELGQTCVLDTECFSTVCDGGTCTGKSCGGIASSCGISSSERCCISNMVPGGTYNRSNDVNYPATVSDFRLDRFEVSVGRFRQFVSAYPANKPTIGAGAHPLISASGWNAAWNSNLPADQAALKIALKCNATYQTWTDSAGSNENKPINCVTWYDAFAFCAWDGGRLPTEAEWNYAAARGGGVNGQREYPWSNPPNSMTIDATYAVYNCTGDGSAAGACAFTDILSVGAKSNKGDGFWGQADLGGSVEEWTLDWHKIPYSTPCNDCANLQPATNRVLRGGGWISPASDILTSFRNGGDPVFRGRNIGFRCASSIL